MDVKTTRSEFPMQAEIGKREFIEAVKTVKSHIKRGDIFVCVISENSNLILTVIPFFSTEFYAR